MLVQCFAILTAAFSGVLYEWNRIMSAIPMALSCIIYAFVTYAAVQIFIMPIRGQWAVQGASDTVKAMRDAQFKKSHPRRRIGF